MNFARWSLLVTGWLVASCGFAAESVALFNDKDLTGWEGKLDYWSVKDQVILGNSPGLKENYFLATTEQYGDFELRFEVKLHDNAANSGVQFRSQRIPDSTEMIGYQADIGQGYWGALYDESRRRKILAAPDPELIKKTLKPGDWNEYVVRAVGKHITLSINGVNTVDYLEPDDGIARTGHIALQVHSGKPFQVEFRKITIKKLTAE